MTDDSDFRRMVAANADDIRDTVLRNLRRQMLTKVISLSAAIVAGIVLLGVFYGWTKTLIWLAIGVPLAVAYGWWSWNRKHRTS